MASWTLAIGAGLRALLAGRIRQLDDRQRWAMRSGDMQVAQLRRLLQRARETEFGRAHAFDDALLRRDRELVEAFRAATPIATYDDLKPQLERMRRGGEPDVCWPGLVRDWAQTSGTTAGDKFMPVSRDLLAHNRKASFDVFAHAARFGVSLPGLYAGKLLFLGGSTALEENEHGVRTGDLSGVVTQLITWPLTEVYLPGRDIALMSDWPAKIDAMARACVGADIRMVSGMASWSLVLFERVVELARERDPSVRTLRDVWPNLRLFVHGGVRYDPFEPRVREVWSGSATGDDVPTRLEVYPASEGFVAMQDTPGDRGLRLGVDYGVFYEFVPVEDIHRPDAPAFTCDRVERGQRYVVVMSTPAGMWRYVLGDVVEFDEIPHGKAGAGPARLRIVGRHRLFINAFGENVIVEHIENAVVSAMRETGVRVGEFTAAPVYPAGDRHAGMELVIEWEGARDAARFRAFADVFDRAVKAQNNDYTAKRAGDRGMGAPTLSPVAPGAFHAWLESRGKLGGQHKCPRCANHREFVDGVLAVARDRAMIIEPARQPAGAGA
jgi:hypothetical protein